MFHAAGLGCWHPAKTHYTPLHLCQEHITAAPVHLNHTLLETQAAAASMRTGADELVMMAPYDMQGECLGAAQLIQHRQTPLTPCCGWRRCLCTGCRGLRCAAGRGSGTNVPDGAYSNTISIKIGAVGQLLVVTALLKRTHSNCWSGGGIEHCRVWQERCQRGPGRLYHSMAHQQCQRQWQPMAAELPVRTDAATLHPTAVHLGIGQRLSASLSAP